MDKGPRIEVWKAKFDHWYLNSEMRELTFTCCHLMGYTKHYEKSSHTNNHTNTHTYAKNRKNILRDAKIAKITFIMVIIIFINL